MSAQLPVACHPRHALTLCASLVENPMNLGALCRTAEVLGLQELVLPTLSIVDDKNFRKLAVSAQKWQPLSACAPQQLPIWISQQRSQGHTVIALTRHPLAVQLPDYSFPWATVLLLGRELTGIPNSVMQQCDDIIQIPQFGLVESLNVHTAAAIATYAYLCQHESTAVRAPQ
ncbi:MAG: RNA methyltransferase [Cyanobacteria bacterium P01_H01_bin.58]